MRASSTSSVGSSDSEHQTRISVMEQQRSSIAGSTLDRLIDDDRSQASSPPSRASTVTDAADRPAPARRGDHARSSAACRSSRSSPRSSAGATDPTDAQKAAAKAKAEAALAERQGRQGVGGRRQGGLDRRLRRERRRHRLVDRRPTRPSTRPSSPRCSRRPLNALTDVIEGADGAFRIAPGHRDRAADRRLDLDQKIEDAGISMGDYRDGGPLGPRPRCAERQGRGRRRPSSATPQRQVSEIFVSSADYEGPGDAGQGPPHPVHPQRLPTRARGSPVRRRPRAGPRPRPRPRRPTTSSRPSGDPAALATEFEALAKTESDDTASDAERRRAAAGSPATSSIAGFGDAIFADGPQEGRPHRAGPDRSTAGTSSCSRIGDGRPEDPHHRAPDRRPTQAGADFAALARSVLGGADAATGGDIGWVARYQLAQALEDAIFADAGRQARAPSSSTGDGLLPLQGAARSRPASRRATRPTTLKSDAFTNWYTPQQKAKTVDVDAAQVLPAIDALAAGPPCSTRSSPRRGSAGASTRRRVSRSSRRSGSVASPIDPSRPLLVVPLARPARATGPGRRLVRAASPGRHRARPGGGPLAGPCSAGSTRPDHPVGRFGASGRPTTVGALDATSDLAARSTSRRSPPSEAVAGPWAMPWISRPAPAAGRLPVGPRADPRVAPQAPPRGGLRGLRRARADGATPDARRRARRPPPPGRPPRPARRRGGRLRPDRRPGRDRRRKIVRRHPHVFGDAEARTADRREPAVGADQGRRAGRGAPTRRLPTRTRRRRRRAPERPRRDQPVDAGPRREPGDAGAGRPPRLRLAVGRGRPRQGPRGARPSCARPRRRPSGREEVGDLLMVAGQPRPARTASRPRPRCGRPTTSSGAASGSSSGWPPRVASPCATSSFAELDALWDAAKVEEAADAARRRHQP